MRPWDPRRGRTSGAHPPVAPDALTQARAENRPLTETEVKGLTKPKPPTEQADARALAKWVQCNTVRYPPLANFMAIPLQGGAGKTHRMRAIMRMLEGTKPGYPDNLLDVARGPWHGLRIELKRAAYWSVKFNRPTREGEPTPKQVDWHRRLTAEGYLVWVAWGWQAARDILVWYITLLPHGIWSADGQANARAATLPEIPRTRVYTLPRGEP